jgi:hypothetical protein
MLAAITNTGRRVLIGSMTGVHERWLLDGSNNAIENLAINRRLIGALVRDEREQPLPEAEVQGEMYVGEQVHLLYLIRLASLGSTYALRQAHKGCVPKKYTVDLRQAVIQVLRCGNAECNCQLFDGKRTMPEDAHEDDLVIDLSDIPADHLTQSPQTLQTTLPVSRRVVEYRLLKVRDQANAIRVVQDNDPGAITKLLELTTISLDGDTTPSGKRRHDIFWEKAHSRDRLHMRSMVAKAGCGVDTRVNMTCKQCRNQYTARFDMGSSDFWIPDPAE